MTGRVIAPVEWHGGALSILDQRLLPHEEARRTCRTLDEVSDAITSMAVRGAPILGIVAAYTMAMVAWGVRDDGGAALVVDLERAGERLRRTRPTAAQISWAVDRMLRVAGASARKGLTTAELRAELLAEAEAIEREDAESCDAIGRFGAELVPAEASILTHCNTGMLCTGGIGTAQGIIYAAHLSGKRVHVFVDETRPLWQGARLTCWELGKLGIPHTLVVDSAAASLMAARRVDLVVTGADRIAGDGSVANKIGTYGLAVLARQHDVPFVVAAPMSTVDLDTSDGADIPIEQRPASEVTAPMGRALAAPGTTAANPAFDVTPAALVSAIVTEVGVLRKPYPSSLRRAAGARRSA